MNYMAIPKKAKGRWITVEFYDHSIYSKKLHSVHRICGKLEDVDDKFVHINWWYCLDDDAQDDNHEWCSLAKSCIIRWGYSEPDEWHKG